MDFFAEAADEEVPVYKVELAKSNRSKCAVCRKKSQKAAIADSAAAETSTAIVASTVRSSSRTKKSKSSAVVKQQNNDDTTIDKGDIRVGSLDETAGTYGRWHHLECWRVPKKVQNGLTNPSDEESSLRDLLSMVSCWEINLCVV